MDRMGIWIFLCVSHLVVIMVRGQQMSSDGCYEIYPNSKVNCMQPYRGQVVASEQQCRDQCSQEPAQCKAVQYTQATQQCDLYSSFLPVGQAGRKKRELESPAENRIRRGSYQGYRPTYLGAGQTYPAPAPGPSYPAPGPSYPAPQPSYRPQPQPASYQPAGYKPAGQTYPAAGGSYQPKPQYGGAKPSYGGQGGYAACGGYGPTVQSVTGCTYCRPTGTCLGGQTTLPPAPVTTASPACPAGQVLRYYKAEQFKIQGTPDATFNADTEQACLTACTNNQQTSGQTIMCKSADYNSQTKQCLIYTSQAFPPQGTATATNDPAFVHYEKVCIDASLGNRCPGPFLLLPQRILIGFANTVTTASSLSDCLNLCANSQGRFGFACQSGMFYSKNNENNCILNTDTKNTHPDVFAPEVEDQVSYFETSCQAARVQRASISQYRNRNVLQLNTPDFGPWTLCDRMVLDHQRFKQCTTLNPKNCKPDKNQCDPQKEEQYDLQIVQPIKHLPNNSVILLPTSAPITDSPKSKTTSKESSSIQPQARVGNPGPIQTPGKCFPLINLDGTKDCGHGTMFSASGKRSSCIPTFGECIG